MPDDARPAGSVEPPEAFRLLIVPGVVPTAWLRMWRERWPLVPVELIQTAVAQQVTVLRDGRADVGLVRAPLDQDSLSVIPLYTETSVVMVPGDHALAGADEVTLADLAGEVLLLPDDAPLAWVDAPGGRLSVPGPRTIGEAVELVAAGVGVLVVPQSLARLNHRHGVTYRSMVGAPTSTVALAWPADRTTDRVEAFIGIVRGRTVNSTRGPAGDRPAEPAVERRSPDRSGDRSAAGTASSGSRSQSRRGRSPRTGGGSACRRRPR